MVQNVLCGLCDPPPLEFLYRLDGSDGHLLSGQLGDENWVAHAACERATGSKKKFQNPVWGLTRAELRWGRESALNKPTQGGKASKCCGKSRERGSQEFRELREAAVAGQRGATPPEGTLVGSEAGL